MPVTRLSRSQGWGCSLVSTDYEAGVSDGFLGGATGGVVIGEAFRDGGGGGEGPPVHEGLAAAASEVGAIA